jgi:hypothetical protein
VRRICQDRDEVAVFYGARARNLGELMAVLEKDKTNMACGFTKVTVVTMSDGARARLTRSEGFEPALEHQLFRDGTIQLVYPPLADPDQLRLQSGVELAKYGAFVAGFGAPDPDGRGFAAAGLDDGWAIMAYDSAATIAHAAEILRERGAITRGGVATQISGFNQVGPGNTVSQVAAAEGYPIVFDGDGNRVGIPQAVRLRHDGTTTWTEPTGPAPDRVWGRLRASPAWPRGRRPAWPRRGSRYSSFENIRS